MPKMRLAHTVPHPGLVEVVAGGPRTVRHVLELFKVVEILGVLSNKPRWTISLEEFLRVLFGQMGYHAEVVGRSGDFGADLVISKANAAPPRPSSAPRDQWVYGRYRRSSAPCRTIAVPAPLW